MKPKLLSTLPGYTAGQFAADAFAGVTVAMVALPLSIAIAIASGADPAAGLVTAIVAGFLISLLGGSRVQIGGPTGAFIVVVYAVIAKHGYDGLVLATLMAGMILVLAGLACSLVSPQSRPEKLSSQDSSMPATESGATPGALSSPEPLFPGTPPIPTIPAPVVSSPHVTSLHMLTETDGWAITDSAILRTNDGGSTWYNVVGRLRNTSGHRLRWVKLRIDAVAEGGKVVASTDTYNESAEVLTVPEANPQELVAKGKVKALDAGAEERFRGSFLKEETPAFTDYRVVVVETPEAK